MTTFFFANCAGSVVDVKVIVLEMICETVDLCECLRMDNASGTSISVTSTSSLTNFVACDFFIKKFEKFRVDCRCDLISHH